MNSKFIEWVIFELLPNKNYDHSYLWIHHYFINIGNTQPSIYITIEMIKEKYTDNSFNSLRYSECAIT